LIMERVLGHNSAQAASILLNFDNCPIEVIAAMWGQGKARRKGAPRDRGGPVPYSNQAAVADEKCSTEIGNA
uniref:Transposase n=1 Tax=Toxocara canis TaxID=6265 RepID=A0A183V0Q5_TOXCA